MAPLGLWRFKQRNSLSQPLLHTDSLVVQPLHLDAVKDADKQARAPFRIYAEHTAWVADMTRSDAPFDPAFLDSAAVNQALAKQF